MRARLKSLVLAVPLALALMLPFGGGAWADPAPNDVVRADVIAESLPLGYYVTAVAIEYTSNITVESNEVPVDAFQVTATLTRSTGSTTAPRTIVRAYTNNAPARTDNPSAGRYLVLDLSTDDPNAAVNYYTGITGLYPLDGAYTITQLADVYNGTNLELPASGVPMVNSGVISPIVDEFAKASFTSTGGLTLGYRIFSPAGYDKKLANGTQEYGRRYPLVLALHGAGERGTNNTSQIVANQIATSFAAPDRQTKDPSFVVAPQAPLSGGWTATATQAWLIELIGDLEANYPIDASRIYLTGLSMGSMGGWALLPKFPDIFAAALLITGAGDPAQMPLMNNVPVWATHSRDDSTVRYDRPGADQYLIDAIEAAGEPVVRGEWAGDLPVADATRQARDLWNQARQVGSHTLYTTYLPGTTPVNPHWSWVPTYGNPVILDWLFSNSREG